MLRLRIPELNGTSDLVRLDKGYSSDVKYAVYGAGSQPVQILRTFDHGQEAGKRIEYENLQLAAGHGVKCSEPIAFGILPDLELGYILVSYIEGDEASEALPRLSERAQFDIGLQAGEQLKLMNSIDCPVQMASWQDRIMAKYRRYRSDYADCGVSIRRESELFAYIDKHLSGLEGRPNRFQHDDFHPANLIVKDGALSGVIDFNRCDWGDPVHEFVKVGMFGSEVSVPFSVGQIRGYHGGREPAEEFWRLYSLYLATTMISSVVWTLKVVPDQMEEMLGRIHRVLEEDHDGFAQMMPKWYREADFA
ncbi:phosphotransferase [Paenibacillus sacheonensis]|uniref:Phosphotransferase n=2 Tax=Paenibacillus sacheonensis TaxID=742054 RepID=A0A7X5C0H3_9BACL|nr:phosphotransferase [Paenibacillus sacheonensis]